MTEEDLITLNRAIEDCELVYCNGNLIVPTAIAGRDILYIANGKKCKTPLDEIESVEEFE
jgi:hypothetical protein